MYYYIKIKHDTNGNPRYLVNLTEQEAKKLGARKAGKRQALTMYDINSQFTYFNYIVTSYNIQEKLKLINKYEL